MNYLKETFARLNIEKIVRGILISLGGALLASFIVLCKQVTDFLAGTDPALMINWRAILLVGFGAFSTSIINFAKHWIEARKAQALDSDGGTSA